MGRRPLSIRNLRVTSCAESILPYPKSDIVFEVERTFKGPRALRPLTLGATANPEFWLYEQYSSGP